MSRNVSSPCCDSSYVSQCALHMQNWKWNWELEMELGASQVPKVSLRVPRPFSCNLRWHLPLACIPAAAAAAAAVWHCLFVLLSVCLDFWQPCQGFRLPKNVIFIVSAHLGAIEVVAAPDSCSYLAIN